MVEVVDYQPSWPRRFFELREAYAEALNAAGVRYRSIEHVGSTSVPGLAAKPVIDVDVIVQASDTDAAIAALAALGFVPRGELGVAERFAFFTPERFAPTNTYVVVEGSLSLRNHLAVRNMLRADAALRREYDDLKRAAAQTASDIDEYIELKSDVLGRILERAGLSSDERATILEVNRAITGRGAAG